MKDNRTLEELIQEQIVDMLNDGLGLDEIEKIYGIYPEQNK